MSDIVDHKITIERVTDPKDVPILANICDEALKQADTFYPVINLYAPASVYENAVSTMTDALQDPDQHLFKVVAEQQDENGRVQRVIIGLCHWKIGYISIPKVDPFSESIVEEPVTANDQLGDAVDSSTSWACCWENIFNAAYREGWNAYISAIRGKKHVYLRRVAVLPAYQGRGIATDLLKWGVNYADREGLHGWLFARPAGMKMYVKAGWRPVATSHFDIPGIVTAPIVAMLRKPDPVKKIHK